MKSEEECGMCGHGNETRNTQYTNMEFGRYATVVCLYS